MGNGFWSISASLVSDSCPTALLEISAALEGSAPTPTSYNRVHHGRSAARHASRMGNYTQSIDSRIVGLTGTPQQIAAVAQEYGVYYEPRKNGPGAEDYVMDHSTYLYLMGTEGEFVRGFDADASGEHIAEAVRGAMATLARMQAIGDDQRHESAS